VRVAQIGIGEHHDHGAVRPGGAEVHLAHQAADDARAIELRAFGGLSFDEIAQLLEISRATLARDYRGAQAWLYRKLEMPEAGERSP